MGDLKPRPGNHHIHDLEDEKASEDLNHKEPMVQPEVLKHLELGFNKEDQQANERLQFDNQRNNKLPRTFGLKALFWSSSIRLYRVMLFISLTVALVGCAKDLLFNDAVLSFADRPMLYLSIFGLISSILGLYSTKGRDHIVYRIFLAALLLEAIENFGFMIGLEFSGPVKEAMA
mmetsp:Transcript_24459/g.21638  ORF Transcript_24459/g.21638 Transcript_24459/m.21638 type:complete len:175 (+) Transcript_24459:58-582(+)